MDLPDLLPDLPDISEEMLEKTQAIHEATRSHDLSILRPLLRNRDDANVSFPTSLQTPLHTVVLSFPSLPRIINGGESHEGDDPAESNPDDAAALKTLRYLLQSGAIWNALDANDETPGCIALRLGNTAAYEVMVDAGVRAELLFNTLEGYQELEGEDPDDEEEEDEEQANVMVADEPAVLETLPTEKEINTDNYLQSDLTFSDSKILDSDANGVMMSWETPIMELTASLLLPKPGLTVLNVGHGMGIVDNLFQSHSPSAHHIIEAHPDVLKKMRDNGWYEKPGVTVHEGTWQTVLPALIEQGVEFDAIYYDTFAEPYSALKFFFSEHITALLSSPGNGDDGKGGRWSFFNGLGADRQVCYDVYTKVVEMDMFDAGFETEWTEKNVENLDQGEWDDVKRKYWSLKKYRLPLARWMD